MCVRTATKRTAKMFVLVGSKECLFSLHIRPRFYTARCVVQLSSIIFKVVLSVRAIVEPQ